MSEWTLSEWFYPQSYNKNGVLDETVMEYQRDILILVSGSIDIIKSYIYTGSTCLSMSLLQ